MVVSFEQTARDRWCNLVMRPGREAGYYSRDDARIPVSSLPARIAEAG